MSSNRFLKVGDQVKLSVNHEWSRDESNPTDSRGFVESVPREADGTISVRWGLQSRTRTNSYRTDHSDLVLLPATVDDNDVETIVRFQEYCDALGIGLRREPFNDNKVTLTPMHNEQIL